MRKGDAGTGADGRPDHGAIHHSIAALCPGLTLTEQQCGDDKAGENKRSEHGATSSRQSGEQ
jgi:hypothetical protein